MKKSAILWFRNDLRLNDNPVLHAALKENDAIIPLYVLDERLLNAKQWNIPKIAPHRLQFLLESIADLKEHLMELHSNLIFQIGKPEQIIPQIASQFHAHAVYAAHQYATEEIKVQHLVKEQLPLNLYHSSTLIHPDDVPFSIEQLPAIFTEFRKKVEKYSAIRPYLATPDSVPTPALSVASLPTLAQLNIRALPSDLSPDFKFKGGALEAFKRLEYYLWKSEKVTTYKETRNGLIGPDYATRFSPWLADGSISARRIFHELETFENEVEKNESTYWVKFELLWRDFFKYVAMHYGNKIFLSEGIKGKGKKVNNNQETLRKWMSGNTGDPFVDANMRELLFTGWMSNRGRQNVASYLVHQLKQDWRKGAAWFEALLLDYDPESNYGNWMYAAGVGNDPRDRIFNTKRQAEMYDKDKSFQHRWLAIPKNRSAELVSQLTSPS